MNKLSQLRIVVAAAFIAMSAYVSKANAQDKAETPTAYQFDKSLFLEILGASNGIGANYEQRFKNNPALRYRIGVGVGYSSSSSPFFGTRVSETAFSVPVGITYLRAKKVHALELGAGANIGYYCEKSRSLSSIPVSPNSQDKEVREVKTSANNIDAFIFGNIGYRYTSAKGFQFRAGITQGLMMTNSRGGFGEYIFSPYISFGKSF